MRIVACALLAAIGSSCGPAVTPPEPPRPLPTLRVEQVAGRPEAPPPVAPLPLEDHPEARVTLTAVNTDLRAVLAALADAAGVNLVVGGEVRGRVTVHFDDVPALEALRTIILETGHMVREPFRTPWGPAVFHAPPVNVNEADAETISARFGVSLELARFLVQARTPFN